jgi:hypothetical protein
MADRQQVQEIKKILQSRQATAGTQRLATDPQPGDAEKQTKEQIDNLSSKPDAPPHN